MHGISTDKANNVKHNEFCRGSNGESLISVRKMRALDAKQSSCAASLKFTYSDVKLDSPCDQDFSTLSFQDRTLCTTEAVVGTNQSRGTSVRAEKLQTRGKRSRRGTRTRTESSSRIR